MHQRITQWVQRKKLNVDINEGTHFIGFWLGLGESPIKADLFNIQPLNESGWRGSYYYKTHSALPFAVFLEKMLHRDTGYALEIHPISFQSASWDAYLSSRLTELAKTADYSKEGSPEYDKKAAEKLKVTVDPFRSSHSKPRYSSI